MSCNKALQKFGVQGLIIGACIGAAIIVFKRIQGDIGDSEFQKMVMRRAVDYGMAGGIVGLIYAALKSCLQVI